MSANETNTSTDLTMDDLLALIEKTDLPTDIKARFVTKPYLLMQLMNALGHIRFQEIEGNRVYAFLLIVDRSGSVKRFVNQLVDCIIGTFETLKTIKASGTLVGGCVAITDEVQGGEVLVPFTPASSIRIDAANFPFHPAGLTPLHDTVVVALVALRLLARMMVDARKKLVPMAYIVSDGHNFTENDTPEFTEAQAAAMVAYMRTGRLKGRVAGVGVCGPGEDLTDAFTSLGVPPDAIRQIGFDREALEGLFSEISRSVESTSQSGETGGF